jgi:hypothetical protein
MPAMILLTSLKDGVNPEDYEVGQTMTERYAQNT